MNCAQPSSDKAMPRTSNPSGLTAKQERFVAEYLVDHNGAQAAKRAGYSAPNARNTAHELLNHPRIKAEIVRLKAERCEATKIDAAWVLARLKRDAEARIGDLYDDQGRLRDVSEWPDAWQQGLVVGIESFEEYEGTGKDRKAVGMVRKIKLADRTRYIDMIGRHVNVGAFKPLEVSGPNGGPIQVAAMHVHLTAEEARAIARQLVAEV